MKTKIQMRRFPFSAAICAGAILSLVAAMNVQAQYTYTALSVPGASSTAAYGISGNNIVGFYLNGSYKGFLYNGSTYATLSVPGASQTLPVGISGSNIVGAYVSGTGELGFLFNGSTYTTLSVPGALLSAAIGISGSNIVGYCYNSGYEGFIYNTNSGVYTTLTVPGAVSTYAYGISGNTIVGAYATSGSIGAPTQAFLYNTNSGNYTTLSIPGATTSFAYGISGNSIVGGYDTSTGDYGFLATAVLPLNLMSAVGGGQFHLIVSGSTSSTIVQASTNMLSWVPVYTNTPPFTFTDTTMTLLPCRFYRALASQ